MSEQTTPEQSNAANDAGDDNRIRFRDLGLHPTVLEAVRAVGYESPSPIQAATIPELLKGRDLLGQAQTGTGKTAAFALPILSRIDPSQRTPQALVLAPTRELAIQVAEAFQKYSKGLDGFHVLPIYGGQAYGPQLSALKRGVQVVVGTPGRVIDHLTRGSLDLSELRCLVLDEADEMLRMGFIDDVEAVLQKTPETRQVALFSATMPAPIKRIAQTYLRDPAEVQIASKTTTAAHIRQRYWWVSGMHKLDALTRILEAETFDGMIIFARTKMGTEELAQKLEARGFAAAAINGDVAQAQREATIGRLRDGKIDILVATDVAARGLDVERISHVVNYDIPYDTESYVHRIGRTGRAGREGDAILFVSPREKGMLRAIERATRQPITEMQLPSVETVNDVRISRFMQKISDTLASAELADYQKLVERYQNEHNVPATEIAAALARLLQGDTPLLLEPPPKREFAPRDRDSRHDSRNDRDARKKDRHERSERPERGERPPRARDDRPLPTDADMETYRVEVGHQQQIKPGNLVGAIANEIELDARYIGRIDIRGSYSLIDLPKGMPPELFSHLKKVRVGGEQLRIRHWSEEDEANAPPESRPSFKPRKPFHKEGAGRPDDKFRGKPRGKFAGDRPGGDRGPRSGPGGKPHGKFKGPGKPRRDD